LLHAKVRVNETLRICAMHGCLLALSALGALPTSAQQLCVAQELGESQIYDAMTG
jgi:hypothetical protein